MILLIDNYDSFTYNLYHYLGELGADVRVFRNDKITLDEIEGLRPEKIVISPGPCTCLGHQSIGAAFGGEVIRAPSIMHGKLSEVTHDGQTIFSGLKNPFAAMRYHSLVIDPQRLPADLAVTARTADGVIMAVRHKQFPIEGVQFHPESILAEEGKKLLKNFLEYY
ncbi:MAG: aminodeoxychorismate/anthranilate synthase component II [Deltaproteobacteria bacterium]|nr:aminodeoxychorismate/anthranilate synthase component II [Deltaproteobacteria bacterium]